MTSPTLNKQLHAAAKAAGLSDDDRRARQLKLVGKASSSDMTDREARIVIDDFNALAPAKAKRSVAKTATGPYAAKLRALWISGYNLGIFESPDDAALIKFCQRQTGLEHTRWLIDPAEAEKVIEPLKQILQREGGVTWRAPKTAPEWMRPAMVRVCLAQFQILLRIAPKEAGVAGFAACYARHMGKPLDVMAVDDKRGWQAFSTRMGELIRAARKGSGHG